MKNPEKYKYLVIAQKTISATCRRTVHCYGTYKGVLKKIREKLKNGYVVYLYKEKKVLRNNLDYLEMLGKGE